MKKRKDKVLFFDLWFTLIGGLRQDPILSLQKIVGYNPDGTCNPPSCLDQHFQRFCLTLWQESPQLYLQDVMRHYGFGTIVQPPCSTKLNNCHHQSRCKSASDFDIALQEFEALIKLERQSVYLFPEVSPTLSTLKRAGITMGVISNLWPFCANTIFNQLRLSEFFETRHQVFSYQTCFYKPQSEIFLDACERLGVEPSQCIMVGDSMTSDIEGALSVGMDAVFICRSKLDPIEVPSAGVDVIHSIDELLTLLI